MLRILCALTIGVLIGSAHLVDADIPHSSREEAIALLQNHHIYQRQMELLDVTWDERSHTWIVKLRDPLAITTWGVDVPANKVYFHGRKVIDEKTDI